MDFVLKPEVLLRHMLALIPTRLMNLYMPFTLSQALKMNPALRIYLHHISNWNSTGEYIEMCCLLPNRAGEKRTGCGRFQPLFFHPLPGMRHSKLSLAALPCRSWSSKMDKDMCRSRYPPAACLWCEEQLACSEQFAGFRGCVKW